MKSHHKELLTIYKIEVSTPYPYEQIIKTYFVNTWAETYEKIEELKKLNFENIEINLYKRKSEEKITYPIEEDDDIYNFIGNFEPIKRKKSLFEKLPSKNESTKKIKKTILTVGGCLAAFPILTTIELIKKS